MNYQLKFISYESFDIKRSPKVFVDRGIVKQILILPDVDRSIRNRFKNQSVLR